MSQPLGIVTGVTMDTNHVLDQVMIEVTGVVNGAVGVVVEEVAAGEVMSLANLWTLDGPDDKETIVGARGLRAQDGDGDRSHPRTFNNIITVFKYAMYNEL